MLPRNSLFLVTLRTMALRLRVHRALSNSGMCIEVYCVWTQQHSQNCVFTQYPPILVESWWDFDFALNHTFFLYIPKATLPLILEKISSLEEVVRTQCTAANWSCSVWRHTCHSAVFPTAGTMQCYSLTAETKATLGTLRIHLSAHLEIIATTPVVSLDLEHRFHGVG